MNGSGFEFGRAQHTASLHWRTPIYIPAGRTLPILLNLNDEDFLGRASGPTRHLHHTVEVKDSPTAIAMPDLILASDGLPADPALMTAVVNSPLYVLA